MVDTLPPLLSSLNKAAVAAAKAGRHDEALQTYAKLFQHLQARHLSHPELFITHSNKAASHLALGQHAHALQEAKQCLELLTAAATSSGLFSPSRHPHWPKACLRLGQAFMGLGQHQQAASSFEAGLAADPLNPALKSGLQQAQQGLAHAMLSGKTLAHIKALPAPVTPERITLAPHVQGLRAHSSTINPSSQTSQRRGHQVGWQGAGDAAVALLAAADQVSQAVAATATTNDTGMAVAAEVPVVGSAGFSYGGSYQLPRSLLTPAAASADAGLRDVYEYLTTQCAIRAPKQYLFRTLPDTPRMAAWWSATTAAVEAVKAMGRVPRVLLLGAKAGVLAVAALRAGAQHVTCVESCAYLAAACHKVLLDNGAPPNSFSVICTPSPSTLKIGPREGADVPNVCNCLVADLLDDGVLSAGLIPAVSNALGELLVREEPVLVPQRLTVMAQAVGVRPSVVHVEAVGGGGSHGSRDSSGVVSDLSATASGQCGSLQLDLTALDRYRWTPSQALPSPLDPSMLVPLSCPQIVWEMPLVDVVADRSAVQNLDVELTVTGAWSAVAFWADLQLFGNINYSTAGPWKDQAEPAAGKAHAQQQPSSHPSSNTSSSSSASAVPQAMAVVGGMHDCDSSCCSTADKELPTRPAAPLLLTYPPWDTAAQGSNGTQSSHNSTGGSNLSPAETVQATRSSTYQSDPSAAAGAGAGAAADAGPQPEPCIPVPSGHDLVGSDKVASTFKAPPSHQPALCWLPGPLPVAAGDIYPLVASHNTVRCMFTIKEADYSFLYQQEPSFPHSHFAMVTDQHRLNAYAAAITSAVNKAAAAKQQGDASAAGPAAEAATAGQQEAPGLTVVDTGCGSGVLSLLAAAVLSQAGPEPDLHPAQALPPANPATTAPPQLAQPTPAAAAAADSTESLGSSNAAGGVAPLQPLAALRSTTSDPAAKKSNTATGTEAPSARGAVIGIELTGPLAAVAQRAVAANGAAGLVSIVQADAASCTRGREVPLKGADVILLDMFDAGLLGHGVLGLVEVAKSSLAAEGVQIVPASATLYCMGIELQAVDSWELLPGYTTGSSKLQAQEQQEQEQQGESAVDSWEFLPGHTTASKHHTQEQQQQEQQQQGQQGLSAEAFSKVEVCLRALQPYRWSPEPYAVQLHHLPHRQLTAPTKLADFGLCGPAGTPYPREMLLQLEVLAAGQLNGLMVWFDLHLAEGVSLTSAPVGFTTGGRACDFTQPQQQHCWGQALHSLDVVAEVQPGDVVKFAAIREGPRLTFDLLDTTRCNNLTCSPTAPSSPYTMHRTAPQHQQQQRQQQEDSEGQQHSSAAGQQSDAVAVHPAPRPPWLRVGAGIEDPAVWSVNKCEQLLGQMLMRAPGAKFPPIWKDLALMQVHAGSLGLCAATVGAITQELTMREALSVASQKQLVVSPFAVAEAAGTDPPVVWC